MDVRREIEIVLKATDNASATLDKVRGAATAAGQGAATAGQTAGTSAGGWLSLLGIATGVGTALAAMRIEQYAARFAEMVERTNEQTAAYADLEARTTASAEALSRLNYVERMTDVGAGAITGSLRFMAKTLADTGAEGEAASSKIKALGLSLDELRAMEPDQAFKKIVEAIRALPNAFDRTNASMAIFGRGGAMIPQLAADLGRFSREAEVLATVTSTMAREADGYDESIKRVQVMQEAMNRNVASHSIPALVALKEAWLNVRTAAGQAGGPLGAEGALSAAIVRNDALRAMAKAAAYTLTPEEQARKWDAGGEHVSGLTEAQVAAAELQRAQAKARELKIELQEVKFTAGGGMELVDKKTPQLVEEINAALAKLPAQQAEAAKAASAFAEVLQKQVDMSFSFENGWSSAYDLLARAQDKARDKAKEYTAEVARALSLMKEDEDEAERLFQKSPLGRKLQLDKDQAEEDDRRKASYKHDPLLGASDSLADVTRAMTLLGKGTTGWVGSLQKALTVIEGIRGTLDAIGTVKLFASALGLFATAPAPLPTSVLSPAGMGAALGGGGYISPFALAGLMRGGGGNTFQFNVARPIGRLDGLDMAAAARASLDDFDRRYF